MHPSHNEIRMDDAKSLMNSLRMDEYLAILEKPIKARLIFLG